VLCIDKPNAPRAVEDLKLINAGRILENKWTLTESRVPVGDVPGSIITMHVVVKPPSSDKRSGNYFQPFCFIWSLP
jgi:Ubiquitin-2 like Rad60 SUMO-like